jgi:hypothetical protein
MRDIIFPIEYNTAKAVILSEIKRKVDKKDTKNPETNKTPNPINRCFLDS